MKWYNQIIQDFDTDRIYCHKELLSVLKEARTGLAESSYRWALNSLVHEGVLTRVGYDAYSVSADTPVGEYSPIYSDKAQKLIEEISKKYPLVSFTVFETVLMNDFLNHLIAQNTIFIQVEKESSIYVFRFLQELGEMNIMYKPDLDAFNLYWSEDCVVVTDLTTEAPLHLATPHAVTLEKMLVDMIADRIISHTWSRAELKDVMENAERCYRLDRVRLLRYARRRNKESVFKKYLYRSPSDAA